MEKELKIKVIWAVMLAVGLAVSVGFNGYLIWKMREERRVVTVVDGDTFWLKSGLKVRLAGMDAPEMKGCGGEAAKARLKELIEGKVVRLELRNFDNWNRRIAVVKTGGKNVAEIMLSEGWGQYEYAERLDAKPLKAARDAAQTERKGIWSRECGYVKAGESPPSQCLIKGNSRHGTGKIYTLPGCPNYGQIIMEPVLGDRYFCSEEEASAAGYVRAGNCINSKSQ